jgi:UDP-3-O-[3-hydroxymyristoyl] N-acetylglucosamine deacetylase/3-hydroxyacyl-[acyl-carrier-protein] dehydratase
VAENVVHTQRGTVLGVGNVTVSTVEHAFAALYALGIDNCLVEVNAPEFPILDGSAIEYIRAIDKAGIVEQEKEKDFFVVRKKIEVSDPETGSKITLLRIMSSASLQYRIRIAIYPQPICQPGIAG